MFYEDNETTLSALKSGREKKEPTGSAKWLKRSRGHELKVEVILSIEKDKNFHKAAERINVCADFHSLLTGRSLNIYS